MKREYPGGIDAIWVASDRVGNVAAFITAGCGPIPVSLLAEDHVSTDDIADAVEDAPRVCKARILIDPEWPDHYGDVAERGIFVYDWYDVHRIEKYHAYEMAAIPTNPITLGNLTEALKSAANGIRFEHIEFSKKMSLDIRRHIEWCDD